ncbi:hypothetical protein [Xanthomonas sp. GPE 39]|uniref:hypothetical protein n=1 Tax=Xanthomonas sp. GPE 39 TaxID=1583099 RepID=UPI000ACAD8D3|nr:hypothetical protein [Xanthomonas sp. GPE 39]
MEPLQNPRKFGLNCSGFSGHLIAWKMASSQVCANSKPYKDEFERQAACQVADPEFKVVEVAE